MKNALSAVKKYKKYLLIGVPILIILAFFVFKDKNATGETIVVAHSDFVNKVSVSGKVEAESKAELGFAASGRISKIFVENNQSVREGQILAELDTEDLISDLRIKEINSKIADVDLQDGKENLERVTAEENTKVESAYRTLLTGGLELVPESNDYNISAPTLGGVYDGSEGQYKISIDKENLTLPDVRLLTFGLEKTKEIINDVGSTPLGTRGLHISFPADLDLSSYLDTTWFLDIPNKTSSEYLSNLNAYNEAKRARDSAIKNAEFSYQKLLTEKNTIGSSVADAEIEKIRAKIEQSKIRSPFSGIVTNVEKEVGETAASNETVITMMSTGIFQIESFIPEISIALINIGDEAEVTLDAYGENNVFSAKVFSIDRAETIRDGVSTYKVKLQFNGDDERIKAGMTANVSIVIFNKPNVIVLPGGVVFEKNGQKFVQVKRGKEILDQAVILGDTSTLGQVEIVSGLSDGDLVILQPI